MKKILIFGFLVALFLISCKKDKFDGERPDARLGKSLTEYSNLLTTAENGWVGYLFPAGGGGYTFKFNFSDDNRVKMYAALGSTYATQSEESSYRLSAYQAISLVFDSYNYLHLLSDPDPDVFGGVIASGYQSDFEFSFLEASANQDTIKLLGNNFGSELVLVRATAQQGDDYIAKAYAYGQEVDKVNRFPYYHNKITLDSRDYGITVNTVKNTVSFYYDSVGTYKHYSTEYALADDGIILRKPFVDRGLSISSVNDFAFASGKADVKINNQDIATITNQKEAVIIDKDAPRRMYIESYAYTSRDGVNYNGTMDFFGIKSLPNYAGLVYEPRYYVDNYDRLYASYNGTSYGLAFRTAFSNDGVMNFSNYAGFNGTAPGGTNTARFQNTASVWVDEDGFYVFQTGDKGYDLVSVYDSRIWLRFN